MVLDFNWFLNFIFMINSGYNVSEILNGKFFICFICFWGFGYYNNDFWFGSWFGK